APFADKSFRNATSICVRCAVGKDTSLRADWYPAASTTTVNSPRGLRTKMARPSDVTVCPLGVAPSRYTCTIAVAARGTPASSCTFTTNSAPLLKVAPAWVPLSCAPTRAHAHRATSVDTPRQTRILKKNCVARNLDPGRAKDLFSRIG